MEQGDKYRLPEPTITEIDGGWKFNYGLIQIDCRSIYVSRNTAHALIDFYCDDHVVLTGQKIDLNDEIRLKPIIDLINSKPMMDDYGIEVKHFLEDCRERVIPLYRNQLEVVTISSKSVFPPIEYLVKPLLIKGLPTVIFGDGKTGKSTMSQLVALLALSGQSKLGFETNGKPINVLYADYEQTEDTFGYGWACLSNGLGLEQEIHYVRCSSPLADMVTKIKGEIAQKRIDLLIIDSLAYACGGNINEAETANRFWLALKSLPVTTLIIAHTAKDNMNGKQKTIYGSVFFHNMARSIWQMEGKQEIDEDKIDCCLTHIASNFSKKFKSMYFHITFNGDKTDIETREAGDTQFADRVPLWQQIKEVLGINANNPMSEDEIAAALGLDNSGSVRTTLYKYKLVFTKASRERNSKWALVTLNYE